MLFNKNESFLERGEGERENISSDVLGFLKCSSCFRKEKFKFYKRQVVTICIDRL